MHVHLPKPLHGWREFLGEVGIIVIGVLIALGAEQLVEEIRWIAKVREAEEAIGHDLALQSDMASERVATGQCNRDRLVLLRNLVLATGRRWNEKLPAITNDPAYETSYNITVPYAIHYRIWNTQIWDSLVADGTIGHFNPVRARNYALLYHQVRLLGDENQREEDNATALRVLADKDVEITPDAKLSLIRTIDELLEQNGYMTIIGRELLRRIQDSGHLPSLEQTRQRLADPSSRAIACRYADSALKDRVAKDWFTLHR